MKNNIKKVVLSTALASTLIIGSVVPSVASGFKFYNLDKEKGYTTEDMAQSKMLRQLEEEAAAGDKFAKEIEDKLVRYDDYYTKMTEKYLELKEEGLDGSDLISRLAEEASGIVEKLEEVEVEAGELEVVEISAINQTIASDVETELKFLVDGEEFTKTTFDEKYGEEGYSVAFLFDYTPSGDEATTGKVKTTENFKFAVQVEDAEENLIPEEIAAADFAEVTVANASEYIVNSAALDGTVDYVTVGETGRSFEATAGVNGIGEELKEADLEALTTDRAISDDITVATFEAGEINAKKEGTVTFDVYFVGVKDPVEVTVEIKAAKVATTLDAADQKIQVGDEVDTTAIKVLDQYGEVMQATTTYEITKAGDTEFAETELSVIKAGTEAAVYTVKVLVDDVVLGSFNVETVAVADVNPDNYTLAFDKDGDKVLNTLDIKDTDQVATLTLKGTYEDVELEDTKFHAPIEVSTSNDDAYEATYTDGVVTVKIINTAKAKVEDITVTVKVLQGAMPVQTLTETVTVVNTTPQITEVKLAGDAETITKTADTKDNADKVDAIVASDVVSQLTVKVTGDDEFTLADTHIKDVTFENRLVDSEKGEVSGIVTITFAPEYGGKVVTFDGIVKFTPAP